MLLCFNHQFILIYQKIINTQVTTSSMTFMEEVTTSWLTLMKLEHAVPLLM